MSNNDDITTSVADIAKRVATDQTIDAIWIDTFLDKASSTSNPEERDALIVLAAQRSVLSTWRVLDAYANVVAKTLEESK